MRQTLDYLLRDMTDPLGGIYSGEDADSEGEEGKFYLWTPGEIEAVLGPQAAEVFCRVYDVSEAGNFEGRNILHLTRSLETEAKMLGREPAPLIAELAAARAKLLLARAERVRPGRDEKVLVSWNGLAIDALARAAPPSASRATRPRPVRRPSSCSPSFAPAPCCTAGAVVRPNTTPISTITPPWAMRW